MLCAARHACMLLSVVGAVYVLPVVVAAVAAVDV
jgi:hypothetical protein